MLSHHFNILGWIDQWNKNQMVFKCNYNCKGILFCTSGLIQVTDGLWLAQTGARSSHVTVHRATTSDTCDTVHQTTRSYTFEPIGKGESLSFVLQSKPAAFTACHNVGDMSLWSTVKLKHDVYCQTTAGLVDLDEERLCVLRWRLANRGFWALMPDYI